MIHSMALVVMEVSADVDYHRNGTLVQQSRAVGLSHVFAAFDRWVYSIYHTKLHHCVIDSVFDLGFVQPMTLTLSLMWVALAMSFVY